MTIFISIASYCDPLLERTIIKAIETAHNPDSLRFGVVDQSVLTGSKSPKDISDHIKYVNIKPEESRGCCWARSIAMSFYANEEWFFQIDSHMDFEYGWDSYLINHANDLNLKTNPGVISFYPPGFEIDANGKETHFQHKGSVLYNKLVDDTHFKENSPKLQFIAEARAGNHVMRGFHIAAGLIFAPGNFVEMFPYDPQLYFIGEEQSLSVRLYTHGWNIFHTPSSPIYHMYNVGNSNRPMHWDQSQEQARKIKWGELEFQSTERFKDLVFNNKDLGIYGLGKMKNLENFANFCGIDYAKQELRGFTELRAHLIK